MPVVANINILRILDQHKHDFPAAFVHSNILPDPGNDGSIVQGFEEGSL